MTTIGSIAAVTHPSQRRDILARVERVISVRLCEQSEVWGDLDSEASLPIELVSRLFKAGGKRIRPTLAISTYLSLGGDPDRHELVELAAALELLHCFALLQDDVMDECDVRRGYPTGHRVATEHHLDAKWCGESERFGESVAILAGDLAMVYADSFMVHQPMMVRKHWGEMRTAMIIGQHLDLVLAARPTSSPESIRTIARLKSGQYSVEYPMMLGAALATGKQIPNFLSQYSRLLGEAFQLRDDLIGAFGDTQRTGKPSGLDQEQGKLNLLATLGGSRSSVCDGCMSLSDEVRMLGEMRIADLVVAAVGTLGRGELVVQWQEEVARLARDIAVRDH